jgi:ParB-like chromosome segregation protein Spo0J
MNDQQSSYIEYINLSDLTLLETNPRTISRTQMDKLCESLKADPDFLLKRPVLVNHKTDTYQMIVYAGNQRVRAAKQLGWKEIPCSVDRDLPQHIQDTRAIKDNKEFGDWDYDILADLYSPNTLLDCGFLEKELGLETEQKKPKKKKPKICPNCNHEF